jgi:hypothetical protein
VCIPWNTQFSITLSPGGDELVLQRAAVRKTAHHHLTGVSLPFPSLALARDGVVVDAILGNDVIDDVDLAADEAFLGEPTYRCDVLV